MIYGKLPTVFLSALAGEKHGSTNSVIAAYIRSIWKKYSIWESKNWLSAVM